MRITFKLSLAIGFCILVVLGVNAAFRVQHDLEVTRHDARRDHALLGRVLATGVALLLESDDFERANELVSAVNAREHHVQIRWVRPDDPARAPTIDAAESIRPGPEPRSFLTTRGSLGTIITYVAVESSRGPSSIEVTEELAGEAEHVRSTVVRASATTLALLAACMAALLGFGVVFVARPIGKLRDHARRVGEGELGARVGPGLSDELGDLGRELDVMTERLEQTRARADEEAAARAEALDRLRHADRLRAVGEMASAVAHEIGTPLAVVRARAQQLESTEPSPERVREIAGIVIGEVDRVSTIIRRLLSVSRSDVRDVAEVEVGRWAQETVALLEPLARAAQVQLELDVSEASGLLSLEAGKLRQVIINLVMNAIHASPRGGRVWVRVTTTGGALGLVVEDAGPGVPEALRARIFEPFFTTKGPAEGTGLGLSVAAGIVREQGGTVTVGDRVGGGARFEVRVRAAGPSPTSAHGSTRRRIVR